MVIKVCCTRLNIADQTRKGKLIRLYLFQEHLFFFLWIKLKMAKFGFLVHRQQLSQCQG